MQPFIRFVGKASAVGFIACAIIIGAIIFLGMALPQASGYELSLSQIQGIVIMCFLGMGVFTILMFIASKLH